MESPPSSPETAAFLPLTQNGDTSQDDSVTIDIEMTDQQQQQRQQQPVKRKVPLRRIPLSRISRTRSLRLLPGMKVIAHEILADGTLKHCTLEDALGGASASGTLNEHHQHFWIDIDADDRDVEALSTFLKQLDLPAVLTDSLAKPVGTWAPQVMTLKTTALLLVRILPDNAAANKREIHHLAAVSLANMLLTFTSCARRHTGGLAAEALLHMTERERVPGATASGALLAWLLFHVDRTAIEMRALRLHVLKLLELQDENPEAVGLDEIVAAKDHLMHIVAVAEEQMESLDSLSQAATATDALDFTSVGGTLGVLVATGRSSERSLLRLEKRIADLRQSHESLQQDRINARLAVLTVLSAIFLPLTLMAGVYGMNFENIPELGFKNAYFILLGVMGAVAILMICFFWRAGWMPRIA